MKKIILLSSALCLFASYSANATQISVSIGEPAYYEEPVYVAPRYVVAPAWPSEHYDNHRHWHNDYWAHRDEERYHHEHDDHDNGNHGHR